MEIEDSLQKLGLTENEVIIYIYLLRKGLSLGNEIYKDNHLDKSSAYEAISNLVKKGLLYTIGKSRNVKFGAVPADKLYEILSDKEKELVSIKSNIDDLMKNIDEIAKQNYKNKNIRIIEGKDGFEKWAWARLEVPRGSVIRDLTTDELQQTFTSTPEEYKKYSIEMPIKRAEKGIYMRGFMKKSDITKSIVPTSVNKSDPRFLKEVRLLPENFEINCSLVTFGTNTSFLRKKDGEFFGVIINDPLITSIVNVLLDFLWEKCEKI